MNAREAIMQSIRKGLKRETLVSLEERNIQRLEAHIIPQHVQISNSEIIKLFITKAKSVSATVASGDPGEIVDLVKDYLKGDRSAIKVAPGLEQLTWGDLPIAFGTAIETDRVGISQAIAAVAETGTLVCAASPKTPTLLNFLPETSIILLEKRQIMATYEEAWQQFALNKCLPRTINFITGPSRTGDIEQKLLLGIHGPKKLHIILIDGTLNND